MGVQINGDTGNVIATKGTYSGNVTIGGTLTYEDVTNIDSVGLVTARSGIEIGARPGVAASISVDGNAVLSGIVTISTLNVSGTHMDIADSIRHIGDSDAKIRFPDTDTFSVETAGSERLRVGAGGSVGVGTDVPDTLLHLYGSSSTQKLLTFGGGNSKRNNYIGISGADNLEIGVDEHDEGSGSTFRIRIDGAEKARITSGGLLCVGHDSSTGSGKIQASTASQDGIDIFGYNSTAGNGGRLTFYRSKNATVGINTEVADNDSLGRIDWRGYNDDGTAFNIGATIEAEVDGTIDSTTDMPSALLFKTSVDGSSSPTERLRITSKGGIISNGSFYEESAGTTNGGQAIDKTVTFNDRGVFLMLISFSLGKTTTEFSRNVYSLGLFTPRSNGATWTAIQQDLTSTHVGNLTISDAGSAGQLRIQKSAGSDTRVCAFRIDVLSSANTVITVTDT